MAGEATFPAHADSEPEGAALQHRPWRRPSGLSSVLLHAGERFLGRAGFDRAPWLAVAFAAGITGWFVLDNRSQWLALIAACLAMALASVAGLRGGMAGFPMCGRHSCGCR